MRAETGNMAFANDWTGVFIRGDNAFNYKNALDRLLQIMTTVPDANDNMSVISTSIVRELSELLGASNETGTLGPVQEMKMFEECKL
jgi:hypothetical protein